MIDIDFSKVDLAFPKVLAKKLNLLKEAMTDVIDDENVSLSTTYSSEKIVELVNRFGFSIQVVDELPSRGRKNTIYLVPASEEVHEYHFLTYNDTDINYYGNTTSTPNPEYRIGDIIKPTVENPTSTRRCGVISSVGPDFCEGEDGDGFDGITGTITWQKDHYYEITDIVEFKGAVTGDTLGKAFIFEEYDGTPASFVECEELPGCFLYKQEPSQDIKDEYIWVNSQWEKIGSTSVDLSQYYTKAETNALLDEKVDKIPPAPLIFSAYQNNSSVGIVNNGNGQAPNIEISTDNGTTWTTWDYTDISLNDGDSILMRGMNPEGFSGSYYKYSNFTMTGSIEVYGNIMSLIDYTQTVDVIPRNCCFYALFKDCSSLLFAPELPATILADYCYGNMFWNCTSLTSPPELPATELAEYCYQGIFKGCTNLTEAPALPATIMKEGCYQGMFNGCSNLTTAPELPAKTLADGCYVGMFQECSSLTAAPELPAKTLSRDCYNSMFCECTSLTIAPELPAKTLASGCYGGMFDNCTSLSYIKCLATDISASNSTYRWVYGVANSGTFVKDNTMSSWTIDSVNGIPTGWTVVNHYNDITLQNVLDGKSNVGHTHTKSEITDFAHTHVIADITDFVITTTETMQILESTVLHLSNGNYAVINSVDGHLNNPLFQPYLSTLESVEIGEDVIILDSQTFDGCTNLTSINMGDSVTTIGSYVTMGCNSLTSVIIGDSVTTIGASAFSGKPLTYVKFGRSVESIGGNAFLSCNSLTSVTLPASVTSIGSQAFFQCANLTSITIEAVTPPSISGMSFPTGTGYSIYVPAESVSVYQGAWTNYASRIQAIPAN